MNNIIGPKQLYHYDLICPRCGTKAHGLDETNDFPFLCEPCDKFDHKDILMKVLKIDGIDIEGK